MKRQKCRTDIGQNGKRAKLERAKKEWAKREKFGRNGNGRNGIKRTGNRPFKCYDQQKTKNDVHQFLTFSNDLFDYCFVAVWMEKKSIKIKHKKTRCVCETRMPPKRPSFEKCNLYI